MKKKKIARNQWAFCSTILILLLGGIGFILLSQLIKNEFLKASCSNIASAIIVAGIFSAINEKILKDSLVELILSKIKLKQEIDVTGIEEVFTDISNVDYGYYIKSANKNIDILHVYGRTWTSNNLDEIRDKFLNSNCNIRVILVSPDSEFIEGLAKFYNITPEALKEKIQEVTEMWKDLYEKKLSVRKKNPTQSSLKLYYHNGQPASSLYRIDDRIINVQNKFSGGRSKRLTTIISRNTNKSDDIYSTFFNEIEDLVNNSIEVNLKEHNKATA